MMAWPSPLKYFLGHFGLISEVDHIFIILIFSGSVFLPLILYGQFIKILYLYRGVPFEIAKFWLTSGVTRSVIIFKIF